MQDVDPDDLSEQYEIDENGESVQSSVKKVSKTSIGKNNAGINVNNDHVV